MCSINSLLYPSKTLVLILNFLHLFLYISNTLMNFFPFAQWHDHNRAPSSAIILIFVFAQGFNLLFWYLCLHNRLVVCCSHYTILEKAIDKSHFRYLVLVFGQLKWLVLKKVLIGQSSHALSIVVKEFRSCRLVINKLRAKIGWYHDFWVRATIVSTSSQLTVLFSPLNPESRLTSFFDVLNRFWLRNHVRTSNKTLALSTNAQPNS